MAGQGIERREVMRMIALASVASGFPGFRRWAFACAHDGPQGGAPTRADAFKPQFFTAGEFQLVDLLAELIIPEDDSPGAHDAGVSEFIDFMVASERTCPTTTRVRRRKTGSARGLNGSIHVPSRFTDTPSS